MKTKHSKTWAIFGLISMLSITGIAQTTTTNIPNFFNQFANWGTSFNTNYSWPDVKWEFENGFNQSTGTGASDYLAARYNLKYGTAIVEGDFFGVGSSFNAVEAGYGYPLLNKYDFKANIELLGGIEKDASGGTHARFEGQFRLVKFMTANTYATASFGFPWVQGQTFNGTPSFKTGFGFIF